jgi:hypothetical protein
MSLKIIRYIIFNIAFFVQIILHNYKIHNFLEYFSICIRKIKLLYVKDKFINLYPNIDYYSNYYSNSNKTILIINGGGFIMDDLFDILICDTLKKKYINYQILTIKTLKNKSFSEIFEHLINTILQLKNINIVKIYSQSAGSALTLALTKYFKLPEIILLSPLICWNIDYLKNINNSKDFILGKTIINIINDFNFNIKNYFRIKNITKIKIICGSDEILLQDIKYFCKDNNIKDLIILPNKAHSLLSWILYDDFFIDSIIL